MEIHSDRPIDPTQRRRQLEAARGQRTGAEPAAAARPDATYSGGDAASVGRLVQILRNMNPSDVQRIEEIKSRIADGSYTADPTELADLLLGRGQAPAKG